jgi:hypothetical protein
MCYIFENGPFTPAIRGDSESIEKVTMDESSLSIRSRPHTTSGAIEMAGRAPALEAFLFVAPIVWPTVAHHRPSVTGLLLSSQVVCLP